MDQMCRICLEEGADLPIFDEDMKYTIKMKISDCLHEEVEDIEGYPRNICQLCNSTLDVIYKLINRYKESCQILEEELSSTTKKQSEVEEEVFFEEAEIGSESDLTLAHIKLEFDVDCEQTEPFDGLVEEVDIEEKSENKQTKRESDARKKTKREGGLGIGERRERDVRRAGSVRSSSVATSLLEGVYCWSNLRWSYASRMPTEAALPATRDSTRRMRQTLPRPKRKLRVKSDPKRLCDLCGKVFADQTKFTKHKKKAHVLTYLKCNAPGCTKSCNTEYNLSKHQARRHGTQRDQICPICGKTFAFRSELTHHVKRHDASYMKRTAKLHTCSLCDKSYKTRKSVEIHERSVHTGLRPAVCSVCSAAFFHEDYLKEHMRLHTGETPFACPICGRGYAQRGNMKSHMRQHRLSDLDATTRAALRPNYLKLLKL